MSLNNFNSLFELSAALNIGYASFPQLATSIDNLFFSKLFKDITTLEKKTNTAKNRLNSIENSLLSNDVKKKYEDKINQEVAETLEIKESIQEKTTKYKDIISRNMKFFFLLVAVISIYLLVISGKSTFNDSIEFSKAIFDMYLMAIVGTVVWYAFKFLYQPSKHTIDRFILVLMGMLVLIIGCYIFDDFLQEKFLKLNILDQNLINFILCTLLLPFITTIFMYILSFYSVSREFMPKIRKQFNDIKEDIKDIDAVAVDPDALEKIKKISQVS